MYGDQSNLREYKMLHLKRTMVYGTVYVSCNQYIFFKYNKFGAKVIFFKPDY